MFKKFIKVFISFFIIFSVVFAGSIFYLSKGSDVENESSKDVFNNNSGDSINFLLMGVDSQESNETSNVRTDTLMVFNVNKSSGEISILSIPRDTRTPIEGRKYQEKINHTHVYGGPELVLETVSDLLNLDLEYYVVADYKFVEEFVDLIGGVEIDVPMDMKYEDPVAEPPLYIDIKEGLQTLDGDKSLQYLRFRKGYADADLGRIRAQQSFMKSLVKQTLKPLNILKAPLMLKAYNENIDTNISLGTIAKYSLKFNKYDLANMNTETLPGDAKTIKGISYFIHSEEKTKTLVKEMFQKYDDYVAFIENK